MVRTSMGPNGMNKMVINHLERLFVTSDARTIVTELEVQHPAGGRLSLLCPRANRVELLTALCAPPCSQNPDTQCEPAMDRGNQPRPPMPVHCPL